MTIKLECGFTCEVNDDAFNDYRVAKLIAKMNGDSSAGTLASTVELISRVLGDEQEEELITYLEERSETGIATMGAMESAIMEIMSALSDAKKNT